MIYANHHSEAGWLVSSPYNPDFVARARQLGGKWHPAAKCWAFPESVRDAVDDLCRDIYGAAPRNRSDKGTGPTIRVEARERIDVRHGPVCWMGIPVASARGRDSGARVGDGCSLIAGKIESGGSRANWTTTVEAGTVIEIRDAPPEAVGSDRYDAEWSLTQMPSEPQGPSPDDIDEMLRRRVDLVDQIADLDDRIAKAKAAQGDA